MKIPRLLALPILFSLLLPACSLDGFAGGKKADQDPLTIGLPEALTDFSPVGFDLANRRYLENVYEGLVRADSGFDISTSLAVSWGRIEDTVWDFRLREGVLFHDGSVFDAEDVVYSYNLLLEEGDEHLLEMFQGVVSVEMINADKVRFTTSDPDPLLLYRLAHLFILPAGFEDFEHPIGTGAYKFESFDGADMKLSRFEKYWGSVAYFEEAELIYIEDEGDRLQAFLDGELRLWVDAPHDQARELSDLENVTINVSNGIDLGFLIFDLDGMEEDLRDLIWAAFILDSEDGFEDMYQTIAQFTIGGMIGFTDKIFPRKRNPEIIDAFIAAHSGVTNLTLDLPENMEGLGMDIAADLKTVNVELDLNLMEPEAYEAKISSGESDFFFFAWHYDIPDAADFFNAVVHTSKDSYGRYNFVNYSNPVVDNLLLQLQTAFLHDERKPFLEDIAQIILEDHVIMPVFTHRLFYASYDDLVLVPRLNGKILASDIFENVVE